MSKTGQHIISRFRWHTTFDDREKANELQSRISAWSRLEMQREIEAIFDRFCPPGKVWSIPSLELDLGEVDFSSLEPGLSRRIKQQLMAKLEELVLQQQASNGNEELVVSDVRDAGLRFLRHYLLHGVKPWNDTDGRRNINDILEEQWTAGSDAVMEMLHDIAGNSREVRRRMAWQVAEPNIIAIVQKMEPANCDVIVEFRNSMVAVQEKETIVQAAAGDFKKNLWFWILNYLFTMHGSLFNKKEFLKSTIRQMAAHFNIQYEELLRLVMQLAGKLNHIHGRHKEFLVVLNMIASEVSPEAGEDNTVFNVTETTPRRLLKEYFLQKTYAPSPAGKKELNELVCSMAQKDVSWFRSFLQTIKYPHSAWTNILDDLDEASLSAIFTVWNTGAGKMIQSIHFLTALCRNSNIGITRNTLWEAGLGILAQQGGSIPQPRKVLGLMVEKLERVTRLPAVALLEKLIVNETAASYTAFQTVMLRHLQREYAAKISLLPAGEDQLHITMLLQQLSRNDITTAEKQKAEQRLLFFLQTHPAASVKTIMAFDDKQGLEKIIHGTITEQLARKLLPQLPREKVTLLWQLHDLLAVSSQGNMGYTISPAASILPVMLAQGVQEMMTDAAATLPVFLETLLEKVYKAIPAGAATAFGSMVSRFLNGREMPARSVPVALKEKLLRRYAYITPEMAADHILHTVLHTPHRQEEISRLLTRYSRNRSVMALRNHNHAAAAKVINYLLPQGVVIKEKLVAAYARAIARYYPAYINTAIIRRLGEVFWNTIVQYGVYQGNVNAFSKIFYTAVLFNFPLLKEELGMGNKELGIGSSDEPVVENGIGEKGKREKETGTGNDDGHTIENGISQSANPQSANRQPLGEELGIGNEELGIGSSDGSSTETNIPLTSNRQPLEGELGMGNKELGIGSSDEPGVENGIGEKGKREKEKETGTGNDDAHTIENGVSQSANPQSVNPQSVVPLTSNRQPLNEELGIGSSDEPVVENGIGEKGKREKETGTGNDDGHTIENGISQSANPQSANPQSANRQPLGEELGIGNEELGIGSSDDSSTETNIPLTSNRQPLNEELGISRSDEPVVENGIGEKGKREKETGKGNDDAHTIENGISQSAHPQSAVPLTSNRQPLNGELGIGNEELGISRSDEPVVENGIGEKGKREKGTGNDDDHTIENGVSQSANPQSANSQFVPQSSLLLAEQCLNNTENAITFNNISYSFSTIWNGLLRTAPRLLVQLIRQYPLTPQRHKMIAGTGSITAVIPWILPELNNRAAMQASAIQHIYEYATALLPAAAKEKLQQEYWQALWTLIRQNGLPAKTVERLADAALHPLVLEQSKNILSLWTYWEEKQPWFLPVIKRSLQRTGKAPHGFDTAPVKNRPGIQLFRSGQAAWINVLLKTAISTKQVPLWFPHHEPGYTAADLLNDALLYFPAACFRFFSTEKNTAVQLEWLTQNIDTQVLVNAVRQLEPGRQQQLDMILQCISASMFTGGSKTWGGITQAQVQKIISGKIFTAWTTGNWRILSPQWFWQELSWTLHTKYGVLEKRLFMDVERNAASLPAPFRKAFERLFLQYRERKMPQPAPLPEPRKKISTMNKPQSFPAKEGITVFNAGLVIVNSYILLLFDRLGITSGNKFVSEQAQLDAVHLLQYIVTGHSHTEEHFLPLNKFLCGLDIAHPVPDGIEILESTRSMIDGLIKAVIGYWPAIGDTSVDGFRGNWLVRKGVLTDGDEKWELTVEKRTYDILLNRSPFSFSVIKLPWMERPLHVTWPF